MDQNLEQLLRAHSERLEAIYASVEKTRKYFLSTLIITVILFVLPLVALFFAIPSFVSTYTDTLNSLNGF